MAGFRIFQVFFLDEGGKLFLFFLGYQGAPFKQHVRCIVDACDEGFNQRLLAAQFWAGIHGFLNRNEHFFIIAVGIVILLDENENVVNIDFNLLDEFNFKNNVVGDILFFAGGLAILPFILQVLVATEIILEITFAQNFIPSKVIKRR